ncbi:MAG: PAS domain S-box protein, partial [Thiotrichales bacterium]
EVCLLALQAAPSGIMVANVRGEIRYVNQALTDMFGYQSEELLGQPIEILVPDQFVAAHRRHVKNFSNSPEPRTMGAGRDLEGVTKDGRRFPVEIGLRPAQTSFGGLVVATIIDITKRKAIEERLHRHEEQLEKLVAERTQALLDAQREKERVMEHLIQAEKMTAVGTLVSGIGHEINNPLYVLFATAEALANETNIDECRAYGDEILKQARSIRETVKNLSLYTRPGALHDLQRLDIATSIADAVHLAQRTLHGNEIEFRIDSIPDLEILAKSEEIQQVLFNIVRNAIQAIDGKGRIEISTVEDDAWVSVNIQDNGPGISDEHLTRIFDPFFTTKGPDQGEGLGLYIVRQIVTRYQGTIDAENAASGGTRFIIRFPVAGRKNTEEVHL